ncbi:hypothetical protein AALO_G00109290 [Alosa alosa]|uniref:Uncharacterized protein n=1 Tax=Alosa alosa TaxID=278164 RepID=A0AAV6GPC9_9TELE|nr:hypothetical protein AALO_G00109290 [Alosa alosa]
MRMAFSVLWQSWRSLGVMSVTLAMVFGVMSESEPMEIRSPAELLLGEWVNDLKSHVVINSTEGATIRGLYQTIVGASKKKWVPLIGFVNPTNKDSPTFVFGIQWEDIGAASCTGFVGQYFHTDRGEELRTNWLLRRSSNRKDDWQATLVGVNIFKRVSTRQTAYN